MVREYIGSRYVPKFMGDYDPTQEYEALCVVDNGSGTSYISKVPTPAGTPLTDTTYWIIYGAASGAIINLQNQIDDMNDGTVNGSLQNQINGINSNISSINNHIIDVDQKIEHITSFINGNSNVFYIGDSWSEGTNGIAAQMQNIMSFGNFYNNSYSGSGFVAVGAPPATDKTFYNLMVEQAGTMTSAELAAIDYVFVAGDINDSLLLSSIESACKLFIDKAAELMPNAEIIIVACNNRIHGLFSRFDYVEELMKCNGYRNAHVMDITQCMTIDSYSSVDHLTADGYKQVANALINGVLGIPYRTGTGAITSTYDVTEIPVTGKTFHVYQRDKSYYAYIENFYWQGSYAFSGALTFTLTPANTNYPFVNGYTFMGVCNVKFTGDTDYTAVPANITINADGTMTLAVLGRTSTTLTAFFFQGGEFMLCV